MPAKKKPLRVHELAALRPDKGSEQTTKTADHHRRVQLSLLGDEPDIIGPDSDECYTPLSVLEPLEALLGGIDTDPCWSPHSLVKPRIVGFTIADNCLTKQWVGKVWLNPPYSGPGPFLDAAAGHARETGERVIALVKLDPSTEWWKFTAKASAIGLWPHRIAFTGRYAKSSAAPFPSAVICWNILIDRCVRIVPTVPWYARAQLV